MIDLRRATARAAPTLVGWAMLALCFTGVAAFTIHASLPDPSVNVRWAPEVDDARRRKLEADFGLAAGERVAPSTWSYRLTDSRRSNVFALVSHPGVEDTHKINRTTFEVDGSVSYVDTLLRALPIGFGGAGLAWLGIGLVRLVLRLFSRNRVRLAPAAERLVTWLAEAARRWEAVVTLALAAYFLYPLLVYGPWDTEESGLGFFSSQVFYRDLFHGRWTFWLNDLGFGTPMPIGQRFDFHPLFGMGSLISLRAAVSATWVVHVAVMLVYFGRLAALLGVGPLVRTALTACYLFSAPSVNYFYATDWLSVVVPWTLYPALAFYLHRALTGVAGSRMGIGPAGLALLGAFWVLNSHPGYIASLALILGLYAVLLTPPRIQAYGCLLAAAGLCAAACAERLYFFVNEASFFPPSLPRNTQGGNTLLTYALTAAVPFTELRGLRQPFIGVIIGVAAATLAFLRSPVVGTRAVGLAFLASALIGILPESFFAPAKVLSGIWFFRDPMVFFGLLAGGVVLQRGIQARRIRWRFVTVVLLGAQLLQQAAAVRPELDQVAGRGGPLRFYRDQKTPVRLASAVVDRARNYGPRLYTSEPVRLALRGGMSSSGIHSITDLVFFGVNPVNGWFKNVSMDRIYPSLELMHGIIFGQRDVIAHQPLLNVLGINLIWATAADGPFPPGLVATDRWRSGGRADYLPEQHDFVLLRNPQAWPRAVLLREEAAHARLPVRPGCLHRRALCRDFSSLEQQRLPGEVELQEENGLYNARFPPSRQPRLLFISATFRPEWQASSAAGPLAIEPVASAFLGIRIPAGVEAVEVRFNPRVRVILAWISSATILSLLAVVGVSTRRQWRAAFSPSSGPVSNRC